MLVDEAVTYLEMTSPDELVPGSSPPASVEMVRVDRTSVPLIRSTYARVGAPHDWISRQDWADEAWEELLARPSVSVWIARLDDEVAGMVELEARQGGDVEITVFGLGPTFVGRGFGGHLLTLATRRAWETTSADGTPARRVWLHTSSHDHPHARLNYERRGFRPYRTEHRQREIPT
jgi:ribosomal protein S18 acetylase RimI-like enzyme